MSPKRRSVIYARCSTTQHDQKPEVQTNELKRYCEARGWEIIEEIVDHGYSGATDKRPGLKRLNELVRKRQVDIVVVVKMDRLFRSIKHLIETLNEFSDIGVEFVSLGEQLDFTTSSGRLLFHIIAAFAEFERALIRERTMMGLDHAVARGVKLGRPPEYDSEEIQRLRSLGKSFRQIQKEIGCSIGVVFRALHAVSESQKNQASKDDTGASENSGRQPK